MVYTVSFIVKLCLKKKKKDKMKEKKKKKVINWDHHLPN